MLLLALSNDSKMVIATLFCVGMAIVVGLLWLVHRQDRTASRSAGRKAWSAGRGATAPVPPASGGDIPESVAIILRADPTAKIEAIKAYRLATGLGLKESKDAVEAWLGGHAVTIPVPPAETPGFPPAVAAILRANPNDKINAIKVYRETTGMGLKESKDAVEAWVASQQ